MDTNHGSCLFCGKPVMALEIDGGGQASFCPECLEKLENEELLEIKHETILLKKPLIEVIIGYPTH
ncbi:MAG: hypothetical protein SYNGOMJ08_00445 [Candidatus Syntrophoarchaeum sp. GoM_oil]|nr:MAG: hypothetical protein SYNGOMJ08_00445 [Candidatus Syntrophoarchaeum sp. GoM_oil]